MAVPPVRDVKVRQPKDFKNYGYGTEDQSQAKGKKGKNPKMPIETEPPKVQVPGYQYVSAPDGQVMLVPMPAPPVSEGSAPLP